MILKGLLALLTNLPQLLGLLQKLGEAWDAGSHAVEVHFELRKFDAATEKAKNEKDPSELNDLFNQKSDPRKP
jgi:hypothetical protein